MIKRISILILIFCLSFAQQIVTTKDGKAVVLFEDGTWQYLEKKTTATTVVPTETQVFVTRTGKKYHLDGCRYLKSKIPSSITKAYNSGLTPCKVCRPPSPTSVSSSNNLQYQKSAVTSGRCQATTKKGTQCRRNAESGRQYCWQHP